MDSLPPLILASGSPYRRALLERVGLEFTVVPAAAVDEKAYQQKIQDPQILAKTLALAKATSVSQSHPQAVVIGSDQLVSFRGRILGKPGDRESARMQLSGLAGQTHELITAMAVLGPKGTHQHMDITRLTMRTLSAEQIVRYVVRDEPIDCAGSYKIERAGIALFSRIESEDQSAIQGLPLLALVRILTGMGYAIP